MNRSIWLTTLVTTFLLVAGCRGTNEDEASDTPTENELVTLARTDLGSFAGRVAGRGESSFDQASNIVTWFAEHFDWTATDYRKRSVQEILERGGGNCSELAAVTVASLEELGLTMRRVREINIQRESPRRGQTAREKVLESGPRMSVFGTRHNDHVWIEILDEETGAWFPADPSLGVVGEEQWLRSRVGFGERFSMDPTSEDMITPFVVLVLDEERAVIEDRTQHYLVTGFNRLYDGRLSQLPSWQQWISLLDRLGNPAAEAFAGITDLHRYDEMIQELAAVYGQLRVEYRDAHDELAPPV